MHLFLVALVLAAAPLPQASPLVDLGAAGHLALEHDAPVAPVAPTTRKAAAAPAAPIARAAPAPAAPPVLGRATPAAPPPLRAETDPGAPRPEEPLVDAPRPAALPAPAPPPPPAALPRSSTLTASLAERPPFIDGKVEEATWQSAPVFREFVQSFPRAGAAPSERTEARVLYDADNLYVSIICYQAPGDVIATLSSRDRLPTSDQISVGIDPDRDGKSALLFAVNAAGVQMDSLIYDDSKLATGWDAVWEAQAARRPDGWAAELRIPLRLLRLPTGEAPKLGFLLHRVVARTREEIDSALVPRGQASIVSRYGELSGVRARPVSGLELSPYVASATGRQAGQTSTSADLGLDLRWQSAGGLSLAAAVNPDFGQVEADELVANFGSEELARPEKRLFFTDGLDLFSTTDAGDPIASHNLFYSRRIGLDVPILGAAKLTGSAGPLELGGFAALVSPRRLLHAETTPPADEDAVDEATTAFAAAALRARLAPRALLRASAVAVQPFEQAMACAEEDGDACRGEGAVTGALGWDVRSPSGEWGVIGQLEGSLITRGVAGGRILRDGTHLESGDAGLGATLRAGKIDGGPWRAMLRYRAASPHFDLNAGGLLSQQNEHLAIAEVGYARPDGVGPLLGLDVGVHARGSAIAAPFQLAGGVVWAHAQVTLPGFHRAYCETGASDGRVDARELRGSGVRIQRPSFTYVVCSANTDDSRPFSVGAFGYSGQVYATSASSPLMIDGGGGLNFVWRPVPRLETTFSARVDNDVEGPRWIESEGGMATLGTLTPRILSATLRQSFVVSPQLSFSGYAQLFTESRRFGQLFTGSLTDGDYLSLSELSPIEGPDPTTHEASLLLRASLRWEYRLGALFSATYSRFQEEAAPLPGQSVTRNIGLGRLPSGPVEHELQLKLSYYWGS